MPGKCFTWFVVFSYVSSVALPLNAQIFREAQAAEPPTPPQAQPAPGAVPPAQPPVAPAPQGTAPAQPGAAPSRPERTLLPPPAVASGAMVSLNFNRADLVEIIHILAQHLRLTYTIDPEVKGTVTINSAEPLRTEDLLPIFHQVLRMNGAVAVRAGNIYRITPIKDGKGLARPMGASREDSFALQIVPVRFFAVAEMKKVLTPFVMPGGEIVENPRGNFLIIVDLPSNIQRLMEIVDLIDVQVFAGTRMEIYQPKVASAEELAIEMIKVMQAYAASVPQAENFTAQFIALPRINQLLVISHSEAAWTYAKRWLDRIDVIAEGPGRRIFVYAVENGKADELANVLSAALGLPAPAGGGPKRTLEDLHRSTPGGASQSGGGSQFGGSRSTTGFPGTSSTGFGSQQPFGAYAAAQVPAPAGQPAAPAPVPQPAPGAPGFPGLAPPPPLPGAAPRGPTPGAPGAPTARPEEQLRIVADPATNSLIIYGTAQEFQNIKNILKELDAVPRQVLLDVLVFEVTLDDTERLGFDYEIRSGNTSILGRTFPSRGSVLTGLLSSLAANDNGITQFPPGVSGIFGPGNVRIFVNALMTDSRIKILSAPSVLASDNRPARIQVGSEEPIATGQLTAATGAVTPSTSTTIQYRNTGRIVTIIPQVNSKGLVNLQALIEVSQRGANVNVGGSTDSFPSFDLRQAETTAVVQDGDTLAIGGIIAENKRTDKQGVPYLMDIPVLGRFFRTDSDTARRTELIMLITPHVIRSRTEGTAVTEEFKSKLSILRNDLERMRLDRERDLEKMKRDWQEQQKPAVPAPADEPPSPSPSSSPARPEPPVTPLRNINVAPGESPSTRPSQDLRGSTGGSPASLLVSRAFPPQTAPVQDKPAEPAQRKEIPAALSVAALKEPPRVNPAATNSAREPSRRGPLWTVQVASLNQTRDAEGIADKLKIKGYDAYVVAAEVKSKLWHRVRVGQGVDLSEAFELRMRLKGKENFDQAFIALR
jgi:general secretion pathway protein D